MQTVLASNPTPVWRPLLPPLLELRLPVSDRRCRMSMTPYRAPLLVTRSGREISRLESRAELVRRADRLHLRRVTEVTVGGLDAAAYISAVERDRAQIVPHAESRLRGIADVGAIGIMTVIHDAAHDR